MTDVVVTRQAIEVVTGPENTTTNVVVTRQAIEVMTGPFVPPPTPSRRVNISVNYIKQE